MTSKIHQDSMAGIIMLVISATLFIKTFELIQEAALYPLILITIFAAFAVFIIINGFKKLDDEKKGKEIELDNEEERIHVKLLKSPLITFLIIIIYGLLISMIGFFPATTLFLTAYLWSQKIRDWKAYLFMLVGFNLFIYVVFVLQLNVPLPSGSFFN